MLTIRYENKYLMAESAVRRLRSAISPFVEPDRYAARYPDLVYPIASLYLDSPELRLFRETEEGRRDRYKLRVRSYSDQGDSPLFCEIKRRIDGVVHKTRCRLGRGPAAALMQGQLAAGSMDCPNYRAGMEFLGRSLGLDARPKVLVRYDREAYVGRFDPDLRITFDRRLRAAAVSVPRVEVHHRDYRFLPGSLVVVEFKFNHLVPSWLPGIIRRFDLRRLSYSKYGNSIRLALGTQAVAGF